MLWLSNASPDAWARRCRTVDPGGPAGSASPRRCCETATIVARAVANFVTDAHATATSTSPRSATISPPTRTATARVPDHPSMRARGVTGAPLSRRDRQLPEHPPPQVGVTVERDVGLVGVEPARRQPQPRLAVRADMD